MLRLLDANVFITAKNTYYGLDLVPAFWSWLEDQARAGRLASTDLVYDELKDGRDDLADWVREREDLIFHIKSDPPAVAAHVNSIATWARSQDYQNHAIAEFLSRADPFLIGAAAYLGCAVVTQEVPSNSRRKLKIPNVCRFLDVPCENTFDMMRQLGARFT